MKYFTRPRLYEMAIRFPKTVLILCLFVTLFSFFQAKKLKIENDLAALLPQSFESVQALHQLQKSFGGLGFLVVTLETKDPDFSHQIATDLTLKIEKLPGVQYVDYERPIEFFDARKWLYLDLSDLKEMEKRLDRSLELEAQGVKPTFNRLMDFADEEDRPDLTFIDIQKKYEARTESFGNLKNPSGEDGRFVVLKIKTSGHQQNLDSSQSLVEKIKSLETDIHQTYPDQEFQIGYTGDHLRSMAEVEHLGNQMTWVSALVVFTLLIILLAYFRNAKGVLWVGLPLLCGVIWTGGATYLFLGHLNVMTGFAAGILAGLGSDYGIYLLTRFYQERKSGVDFKSACRLAFHNTGRATYGSMVTTVAAFVALLFSDFGVSVEFGIIGAMGIFLNYLAMMLILPGLLALTDQKALDEKNEFLKDSQVRTETLTVSENHVHTSSFFMRLFSPQKPRLGIFIALFLCALSILTFKSETQIRFEDGRMSGIRLKGQDLYDRALKALGGTLQPALLIAPNVTESKKILNAFQEKQKNDPSLKSLFREAIGITTFAPENQEEKKEILSSLAEKFKQSSFPIEKKREELIASFLKSAAVQSFSEKDLPASIQRLFLSPKGSPEVLIYLFTSFDPNVWEQNRSFTQTLRTIRSEAQLDFKPIDTAVIATDFVQMMEKDGPKMIGITLLFLLIVLLFTLQPLTQAWAVFFHLVAGLLLICGALWVLEIPINTLNIGAFPIILGTGIDSFIHFGLRYEETRKIKETIRDKLPSVLVSNLTTIVGFSGLLLTDSPGLRSLGAAAVIGLAVMTILCAWVFPRTLVLLGRKA